METTGSWSLLGHVSSESDVSLLSPSGTPGVLDDPEVLSLGVGSITNSEDSVIEGGSAETLQDSTVVELPSEGSGINSDRDWSNSEGINQSLWFIFLNILVGFDRKLSRSGFVVALSILSSVRIGSLSVNGSLLSILESTIHKTSIT